MTVLDRHGTQLVALKPASVAAAAESDIKRRRDKRGGDVDRFAHYAFHRVHVRKARSSVGLIKLALAERERGADSGKRVTRLIYGDAALLEAALAEAS